MWLHARNASCLQPKEGQRAIGNSGERVARGYQFFLSEV